jgi:hypothetical protein
MVMPTDIAGPIIFVILLVAPTAAVIALSIRGGRQRTLAIATLRDACSRLGVSAQAGPAPLYGSSARHSVGGVLHGYPIVLEIFDGGKYKRTGIDVKRPVIGTRSLQAPLTAIRVPWIAIATHFHAEGRSLGLPGWSTKWPRGTTTSDPAFDATHVVIMTIGYPAWGGPVQHGFIRLSPVLAPVLAAVPADVAFYFDGSFVTAHWDKWQLDDARLIAVFRALDVMMADLPSWIEQLARAGAAIR